MIDIITLATNNLEYLIRFFEDSNKNEKLNNLAKKIAEFSQNKRTIYFIGIGKNVPMLQKVVATMRSLSIKATIVDAVDILHGDFGMFEPDDIVICVSKSGTTKELVTTMHHLKTQKMHNVYSINMASEQAQEEIKVRYLYNADNNISLINCVEADRWNKVPTTSPIIFQLIFDAISLAVSNELGFKRNNFLHNHPGGKIGATLSVIENEKNTPILF